MIRGLKILIFRGPGIKNIDFLRSGDQKYRFFVVREPKILIFCGPGTKNMDFSWSERLCNLQESQKLEKQWKIMVLGGPDESPGGRRDRPTRQQQSEPSW